MLSANLQEFYRQQLEGIEAEFDAARLDGDQRFMRELAAVAATCLLRLAGVP